MNFSFAGCGFLGIYHVGVAACLKKYAPDLLVNKISGASAGALAAVCLLCDSPLGTITSSVLKTATEARKHFMGPFSPGFNVEKLLREGLLSVLPSDAHLRVNGRLFISLTRISDGKNILISQFETREELIKCLLATAFIPGFSGWAPISVRGVRYIDGGFTDNLPQLDHRTVIVSPFCGEADICPKDNNAGLLTVSLANTSIELSKENLYRFAQILFPPPPEVLSKMCQQGFNDALDFLQRNCLINCTRCLAVQSRFNIADEEPCYSEPIQPKMLDASCCKDCAVQRQEAILDKLPETVGTILQEAIETKNGSYSYAFSYKPLNFLSVLSLPYVIPAKVLYAAGEKLMKSAPTSLSDVKSLGNQMTLVLSTVVRAWLRRVPPPATATAHDHHHHQQNEKAFSCQLAITEFTGELDVPAGYNRHNFEFAIDLDDDESIQAPDVSLEADEINNLALRYAERTLTRVQGSRTASRFGSRVASRCVSRAPSRPVSRGPSRPASRGVSRAVSRVPSYENLNISENPQLINPSTTYPEMSDTAFDQILNVTNNQEALMAYYYLDDNNEVRVTEIFDMSNEDQGDDSQTQNPDISQWNLNSQLEQYSNKEEKKNIQNYKINYDSDESVGSMSEPEADQQIY